MSITAVFLCARCMDELPEDQARQCGHDPRDVHGAVGMYHCPDCAAMVLAGLEHGPLCPTCAERRHPMYDRPE